MSIRSKLLSLILIALMVFTLCRLSPSLAQYSVKAQPEIDDELHFQITKLHGINSSIEGNYSIYLMDSNPPPWLPFALGRFGWTYFASLPLASNFTFRTINITIYYVVDLPRSYENTTKYANVSIGWFDVQGNAYFHLNESRQLSETAIDSLVFDTNLQLMAGQRMIIGVRVVTGTLILELCFGDEKHDSRIQYEGSAVYIPEFSTVAIMVPAFVIITFITLLFRKRFILDAAQKTTQ